MSIAIRKDTSILGAATNGALAALPIVLGIVANIVAFVSFIAFFNAILSWFGGLVGYETLSLEVKNYYTPRAIYLITKNVSLRANLRLAFCRLFSRKFLCH